MAQNSYVPRRENVKASIDARAKRIMPVHWAGFALAQRHWKEPVERFVKEAKKLDVDFLTPQIGELFSLSDDAQSRWWEEFE